MADLSFSARVAQQLAPKKQPKVRRPMSWDERTCARALAKCRFCPATATKRFAREMGALAEADNPMVTEKQMAFLLRAVHTFRRQIAPEVVKLAAGLQALGASPQPETR